MNSKRMQRLLYFGRNACEYGYQYRRVFEADYAAAGKCAGRYQLHTLSEFMAFAAIAAASGVVGNASYDLIKAVLLKLWKQAQQNREPKESLLSELFESEAGRRRFLEYIHDYTNGFVRLRNRAVKAAIEEEIFVDVRINQRNESLNAANPNSASRLEVDETKRPEHLLAPTQGQFEGLWSALEVPHPYPHPSAGKNRKPKRNGRKKTVPKTKPK